MTDSDPLSLLLAGIGAIGSGVVAGIFYAFSTFVMGALGRLAPPEGIRAYAPPCLSSLPPKAAEPCKSHATGCTAHRALNTPALT